MKNGYSAYRAANVDTADQGKLILIAYDVAIRNCKAAMEIFADRSQIEQRTKQLLKAQDAISELMCSLKLDSGEIASNLYRLYQYMLRQLVEANVQHESSRVTEVLGYLEDLRDAWNEAVLTVRRAGAGVETNAVFSG